MRKLSRHDKDGKPRFEELEARQLLSGAAATAAGYIWSNPRIPSFRANSSPPKRGNAIPSPTNQVVTSAVSVPDDFPGAIQYGAGAGNYQTGHAGHTVGWIVVHTTESTASSAISEFTTPNQQVSANYMVERSGVIDQFVSDNNTAYHCGNLAYNESSIGIEHERYTSNGTQFDPTEQEYEASATLVRWLDSYYNIPLAHLAASVAPADPSQGSDIIGHYQVPDPNNPSLGGGVDHHTDPVDWDWNHYISLMTDTTTPFMPVLIGPGAPSSTPTLSNVNQTLSWMPAPNATSYQVIVKDVNAFTFTTYTVSNGATSLGLTLTPSHSYTWKVTSFNGSTQSITSPIYNFKIAADQPPVIASLTLTPTNGNVTQGLKLAVMPHGVSDPDGTVANVQYYLESNGNSGLQTGAGGDALIQTTTDASGGYVGSVDTTDLPLGSQTLYAIATDNQGLTSTPQSAAFTIVPAATNLTASATSGVSIHISWSNNSPDGTGFVLQRSANGGAYSQVATPASTDTSFDDTGLTPATSYTYRLQAVNGTGSSTWVTSNAATTWRPGDANGDGKVELTDYNILAANFNKPGGWAQGDFDGDGTVGLSDYNILASNFTG